ncbi:pentatricopeptide repeat-containing protein At4g33170-like [Curcuma longa]|uniref:pentatricopeptide repeat-containing protein At4g33170-like n=1 Tax=Curcuma longa TaxID=136217 RepID=UPI003D9DF8DC
MLLLRRPEPRHFSRALNLVSSATVFFDAHSLLDSCAASAGGLPCFASAAHACLLKLRDPPWNKLLRIYCRLGLLHHAHQLFDEMPRRDVVSYNTLVTSHARADRDADETLRLYGRMLRESLQPDHITLTALLDVSSDLVEQIHSHSVKLRLNSNPFVGSAMVNQYEQRRGLEDAIQVFEEIEEVDLVSWNIVIDVCARRGSKKHAAEIFSRMRKESRFGFDCFTLTSVLKTCSEAEDLSFGMQLHGCSLKAGLVFDAPIGNALITMYSKCGGEMDCAVDVFEGISNLNIISWTSMIAGLVQNGLAKEAVSYYHNMVHAGMLENGVCFASVLPAFSKLSNLDLGRMVHSRIIKLDVFRDVMVANALVDVYFKCGSVKDAELAFATMQSRDTVSWTIMINGFGQHGKGAEALRIFKRLERSGANLDTVTFLAVLSTCSHGGLIDEGIRIFHSMVKDHNIKPTTEHYACVIDMLGRAGRLDKAERFIKEMDLENDPLAWEALLGACGIHGAIEMAEKSAEKVMELEPHKDGPYILLSNIYAQQKMWVEKERLRKALDASVSVKEVGYSWSSGLKL